MQLWTQARRAIRWANATSSPCLSFLPIQWGKRRHLPGWLSRSHELMLAKPLQELGWSLCVASVIC